jgi:hypothetical protein
MGLILLFAYFIADVRTKADRLVQEPAGPIGNPKEDWMTDVGSPMLCVQLKSSFALLTTATGPSRYMSLAGPRRLPRTQWSVFTFAAMWSFTDYQLAIR